MTPSTGAYIAAVLLIFTAGVDASHSRVYAQPLAPSTGPAAGGPARPVSGQRSPGVLKGFNLQYLSFDPNRVNDCSAHGPSAPVEGRMILPRYGDAAVRSAVREQIRRAVTQGFRAIRTLVFFSPKPVSADVFVVPRDTAVAGANLANFASDLRAAGITVFDLTFAPMQEFSPECQHPGLKRGACFDQARVGEAVAFETAIRRQVDTAPHPTLWIDLGNEMCPARTMPPILKQALISGLPDYIRGYTRAFPNDKVTISCVGDQVGLRMAGVDQVFAQAGSAPTFYDVHLYDGPAHHEPELAAEFASELRQRNRSGIIGEASLGIGGYEASLAAAMANGGTQPLAILNWPLHDSQTHCTADMAAPFAPQ